MENKIINIAKDFSRYPYGRYRKFSETSGETFREDCLVPALQQHDKIIIELDGTEGYGSSFLDEAFAGLVREEGLSKDAVQKRFSFISKNDPSLIDEIITYISDL